MKKVLLIFSALFVVFLTACSSDTSDKTSNDKKETTKQSVSVSKNDNTVTVDNMKITLENSDVSKVSDEKDSNKKVYSFKVKAENVSNDQKGIGTVDFLLKTSDGKTVKPDYSYASFGDSFEKGDSLTGTVYFVLKKDVTPTELQYKPSDKVKAKWEVKTK
ncbi:DUF4352 domain-containing protein [Listeria aquatica]|uniref:DUF4352 domain-containing protein n=1 Tax=Listeria aquatica FSL S10-1188 TaxID=1265818 RepID=W7ATM4_9LIST|nr:DUF4352 domain-containing protein [Listeria aquatica]EUJ16977.1 hypothetical protein MAQA_14569 [Listeria aquatica FSL S10-1188]